MALTEFRDKSFWLTTQDYEPGPDLRDAIDVDVAIIGAGFTGLSSSYFLKQARSDLRIAILESDVVGFGASGRNGGFSMTKIGMLASLTKLRFGDARATQAHEYAHRAVGLVRSLVDGLALDCDYEHPGLLIVATSEVHAKRLEKEIALAERLGLTGVDRIGAADLVERVHSPLYNGGAWRETECGILNPAKLAWAWKRVITAAGVEVYEHSPVLDVTRAGSASMLRTPHGLVRASKVVFATNAWSGQFPQLRTKQVPAWTYIVMTEPLSDTQLDAIGWAGREGIEDFRNLVHYYRLTADNRVVFGGRDIGLQMGDSMARDRDETIFAKLRSDFIATFPQLGSVQFTHAWGGPISATLDLFPALGYVGGRDWVYSLGCIGHGVSMTRLNGQTIADLVLEKDTELTETFFVNRSVPPMPQGALKGPVVGAIAGFLRWEDRRLDVLPG